MTFPRRRSLPFVLPLGIQTTPTPPAPADNPLQRNPSTIVLPPAGIPSLTPYRFRGKFGPNGPAPDSIGRFIWQTVFDPTNGLSSDGYIWHFPVAGIYLAEVSVEIQASVDFSSSAQILVGSSDDTTQGVPNALNSSGTYSTLLNASTLTTIVTTSHFIGAGGSAFALGSSSPPTGVLYMRGTFNVILQGAL